MKEAASTVIGLAAAAVPVAVFGALTSPGLGGGLDADIAELSFLVAFFYIYSLFFALLLALPLFLLLRRFGLVDWHTSMMAGFLIGITVAILFIGTGWHEWAAWMSFGAIGAFSGFIFWTVWRRGAAI